MPGGSTAGIVDVGLLTMTQLLEQALTEAAQLPEDEQDAVAALILWNSITPGNRASYRPG